VVSAIATAEPSQHAAPWCSRRRAAEHPLIVGPLGPTVAPSRQGAHPGSLVQELDLDKRAAIDPIAERLIPPESVEDRSQHALAFGGVGDGAGVCRE
jgi:hypothetical protein